MTLDSNISIPDFLKTVKNSFGEITFCTEEGDTLNLKSTLSEYVFLAAAQDPSLIKRGKIICQDVKDYDLLKEYLIS